MWVTASDNSVNIQQLVEMNIPGLDLTQQAPTQFGVPVKYSLCEGVEPHYHIDRGFPDVEPWPVIPGEDVIVSIQGMLDLGLGPGSLVVFTAYWAGTPVYENKVDFCNFKPKACPVKPGRYNESIAVPIPAWVPSGIFNFKIETLDANSTSVYCIRFDAIIA